VTVSEFAFLGLGLVLGIATGAAIVEIVRGRPKAAREVRVTVAPGSVPKRRPATLAEDPFTPRYRAPARGGPADHVPAAEAGEPVPDRTAVRSGPTAPAEANGTAERPVVGIPIRPETDRALASLRASAASSAEQAMADQSLSLEAILAGRRPAGVGARTTAPVRGWTDGRAATAALVASAGARKALASESRGLASESRTAASPSPTPAVAPRAAGAVDDVCSELRRTADERCTIAGRAREQATAAQEALRAGQRAYDDHHGRAEQAAMQADPRRIRTAKEAAQGAFRLARSGARTREGIEAAARDWLTQINRINREARDAAGRVNKERDAAAALVSRIERLTVEADAARISAESADAACVAARQAVADCQEAVTARTRQAPAAQRVPAVASALGQEDVDERPQTMYSAGSRGEPAITRLVRGDRDMLVALAEELSGTDTAERQRWQANLGHFVEAVIARAIEASKLTFPLEHPFWGAFTLAQNRDVMSALSSLGYRYDGVGGWMDDRLPGQRDLSLAVGYAGLDPMRIRRWPNESEMTDLLQDVEVASDEFIMEAAGGLTLGELVDALGRRADDLTDLWNDWGRVRPLLLAPA
jgi:hypothetical protein